MIKDVAEKWVAALRSGKYKQAKNHLYDGEGYCCLGVLAKELGFEFKPGSTARGNDAWMCDGEWSVLPLSVMMAAGMRSIDGNYKESTLAEVNDLGLTFLEIADII